MKAFRAGLFGALGVVAAGVIVMVAIALANVGVRSTSEQPTPVASSSHWVQVAHFTGKGNVNTEPFTVGDRWRIRWNVNPVPERGWLYQITVEPVKWFAPTVRVEPNAPSGVQNGYRAGTYFIASGQSADTVWDITVEDQR